MILQLLLIVMGPVRVSLETWGWWHFICTTIIHARGVKQVLFCQLVFETIVGVHSPLLTLLPLSRISAPLV